MNDLLILSKSVGDHYAHLQTVLKRLSNHHSFIRHGKCSFFQSEVEFLGLKINGEGIQVGKITFSLQKLSKFYNVNWTKEFHWSASTRQQREGKIQRLFFENIFICRREFYWERQKTFGICLFFPPIQMLSWRFLITDNKVLKHFFWKPMLSRWEAPCFDLFSPFGITDVTHKSEKNYVLCDVLSRSSYALTQLEISN